MILFVDNKNILNYIYAKLDNECMVYNFTSLYSDYENLILAHVNSISDENNTPINIYIEGVEFDKKYADLIMSDVRYFIDLIKIMLPLYEGYNVILMVYHDYYRDNLMEALIKFISIRYGYRSFIINDIEDLDTISEPKFSPYGLMQLDEDIKAYEEMRIRGIAPEIIPR